MGRSVFGLFGDVVVSRGMALKAVAAVAILIGSSSVAHAQSVTSQALASQKTKPTADFTVKGDFNARQSPLGPGQTLQFDAEQGRWGLKLDLDQPAYREIQPKDVLAGAYFKVTPNVRVGASAGVAGQSDLAPQRRRSETTAPRVRLETAFKF